VQADDEIDSLEVGVRDVADLEPESVRVEPAGERLALRDSKTWDPSSVFG
jgi:hypothetical protein